jgi:hypothetical protein
VQTAWLVLCQTKPFEFHLKTFTLRWAKCIIPKSSSKSPDSPPKSGSSPLHLKIPTPPGARLSGYPAQLRYAEHNITQPLPETPQPLPCPNTNYPPSPPGRKAQAPPELIPDIPDIPDVDVVAGCISKQHISHWPSSKNGIGGIWSSVRNWESAESS